MNPIAGFLDCLSFISWTAGVLVRQFDKGREGYLPSMASETGKMLVQEMREELEKEKPAPKKKPARVIGFL